VVSVVAITAVVAGVVVGAVVAGRGATTGSPAALEAALANAPAVKLVEIPGSDGLSARGVYAHVTEGLFCVSDAPLAAPAMGGGGCNPIDDPLGGRAVSASLAFDGGPALATVKDARISGLAAVEVASLRIAMSDDSFRSVKLKKARVGSEEFHAFGYRLKRVDLTRGIGPVAIVALDANGAEIDRQTTGIG
jgi:hypothetical protein